MAKSNSAGMLSGMITTLNALALLDAHSNRKPKTVRKTTYSVREVYDAKRGVVVPLRTANIIITEETYR